MLDNNSVEDEYLYIPMHSELEQCISDDKEKFDKENNDAQACFDETFPIVTEQKVKIEGCPDLATAQLRYSHKLQRGVIQIVINETEGYGSKKRCSYLYDVSPQECEEFFNTNSGNLTTALNTLPEREG